MNTLRQSVDEYLNMRRNLGFKLRESGRLLPNFADFMEQHDAAYITRELALVWALKPSNVCASTYSSRLSIVRGFSRYRSAIDPRTQVPPLKLLPFRARRVQPYLYSDKEVKSLLQAAINIPCRLKNHKLLPWTYYCLFGLLSVSGLRLGEAQSLELEDVDLKNAILTVRNAKCGKTRLVPLHTSTCNVLSRYISKRELHWKNKPVSSYLFVSSWGNKLDQGVIHRTFYKLSRQIGLRGATDSKGPRLHDFRHRLAIKTLVNWYRSNQDTQRLLPILSTFLGHVHVADTHWYLENSPELMREAMIRLEQSMENRL